MENNTKVIASSPNLTGNLGSCEVKSTTYSIDSWHSGVILQDSCTGKLLAQHEYYDWGYIYIPLVIVGMFVLVFAAVKMIFD